MAKVAFMILNSEMKHVIQTFRCWTGRHHLTSSTNGLINFTIENNCINLLCSQTVLKGLTTKIRYCKVRT